MLTLRVVQDSDRVSVGYADHAAFNHPDTRRYTKFAVFLPLVVRSASRAVQIAKSASAPR